MIYLWIGKQKWWAQLIITVIVIVGIALGMNWIKARGYDKARREYEARDKTRAEESAKLKAHADMLEQRVADAEPKLAAYEKLADEKKKLDGTISDKINQAVEEGKKTDEVTDAATDCGTRAERTCAKLASLKPPIVIDCPAYKRKICSQ